MSCSIKCRSASPTFSHSFFLFELTAGFDELYGNAMPSASIEEAMVLAVYIPPQAPAPGQAFFTICLNSDSSIVPATFSPQASNAETMSNFLSL